MIPSRYKKYFVFIEFYSGSCPSLEFYSGSSDIRGYIRDYEPDRISISYAHSDHLFVFVKALKVGESYKIFHFDSDGAVTKCEKFLGGKG